MKYSKRELINNSWVRSQFMNNKIVKYLFAALSGIMIVLSFPEFNLSGLAWFALVPLLVAINGCGWKESLRLGFVTGIIYFFGVMNWLMVLTPYSTVFWVALGYIVLSLYLSTYVFIFAVAINMIIKYWNKRSMIYHLSYGLLVAITWTGLEILRGYVASGLPWAGLAYTQWNAPPVIQISSIFGSYGVTFLIALVNGAIASFVIDIKSWRYSLKALSIAIGILMACLTYGWVRLSIPVQGEEMKVAMVPGNIRQDEKMTSWGEKSGWIFEKYIEETKSVIKERPDLIVWPETAVPKFIFPESPEKEKLYSLIQSWKSYFLMGVISAEPDTPNWKIYNSVFLFSPKAEEIDRYHKMHLVPVSETFPLKRYLPKKLHDYVVGVSDFDSGSRYTVFSMPIARIGVPICFESVFPQISRRFVREGANVICMVTNAWFVGTHAAEQHFSMAPFRAVENGKSIFRCANYGVSCIIDLHGRVIKKLTPESDEKYLAGNVTLHPEGTFYSKHGDYLPWTCLAVVLFFIFQAWYYERKKGVSNVSRSSLRGRGIKDSHNRGRRSSLTSQTKKRK